MIQDFREVDEINAEGKRNAPPSKPSKIGVDEEHIGDVGEHSKREANQTSVLDVLWS
jgi:hypothetical protein